MEVTKVKVGDRVRVEPILYCGNCYACRQGRQNVCRSVMTAGVHFDGGMREQFLTTEDKLYILPDDLTFHQAVLAEPYTIAVQVNQRAGTAAKDIVLIHGAGPIGIVVMDIARCLGAKCIISEVQPARLAMAKEMGADYTINPAEQNVREEVMRITNGMGPNIVIDAAGIPSVLSEAIEMVSPAGSVVNMCFSSKQVHFRMIDVISKEIRIVGFASAKRQISHCTRALCTAPQNGGKNHHPYFPRRKRVRRRSCCLRRIAENWKDRDYLLAQFSKSEF